MISEAVETRMADARRARTRQNPRHPLLINIEDGRLMPNVPGLGGQREDKEKGLPFIAPHPKYRVYMGDPKATLEERLRLLDSQGIRNGAAVVDTFHLHNATEVETTGNPFDFNRASREDIRAFALKQYGATLDPTGDLHLMKLRAQFRDLAREHGDLPKSGGESAGESLA